MIFEGFKILLRLRVRLIVWLRTWAKSDGFPWDLLANSGTKPERLVHKKGRNWLV